MIKDELNNRYFKWICQLVYDKKRLSYRKLLCRLYDTVFVYTIPLDENRATDGIDFRYRFGHDNNINSSLINKYLDDKPCSVLEMMVALSFRCEESIMSDPDKGNRTEIWFWNMISSLTLHPLSDEYFDRDIADTIVNHFMNHQYKSNGEGGLFTINNPPRDLRTVEIWYQMCWYLDTLLN